MTNCISNHQLISSANDRTGHKHEQVYCSPKSGCWRQDTYMTGLGAELIHLLREHQFCVEQKLTGQGLAQILSKMNKAKPAISRKSTMFPS